MSSRFLLLTILFSTIPPALPAVECGNLSTSREILDCVLKNDPRILASEERLRASKERVQTEGAWNNPDFETSVSGEQGGGDGRRFSASLLIPLEGAWKAGPAAHAARLEWGAQRAEHRLLRQEILGETVLRLARLNQIAEEKSVIEGQVRLCERGLERFARLAFLTTEQKAGRQTLLWGLERLQLEILDLDSETDGLRMELSLALGGHTVPPDAAIQPEAEWPAWPEASKEPTSYLMVERYRRESARAAVKRENRAAWPSLSLGPSFERESDTNERRDYLGAVVSLGLPLWNRNGGNRNSAKALLREAVVRELSAEKRVEKTRTHLQKRYASAVQALRGKEKHFQDGVEKLSGIRAGYLEGRVPLELALEAYRELDEMVKRIHATETSAYEALWLGYALEDVSETKQP